MGMSCGLGGYQGSLRPGAATVPVGAATRTPQRSH